MRHRAASTAASTYVLWAFTASFVVGVGCGGSGGLGGCGSLTPLPSTPGTPFGMPLDQQVEGGMQVRITQPGFAKLSSLIPQLTAGLLPTQANPQCIAQGQQSVSVAIFEGDFRYCDRSCGNGGSGCPLYLTLRPDVAPPSGIAITVPDNPNKAVVNIDVAFDVNVEIPIDFRACVDIPFIGQECTGWGSVCGNLTISSSGTHILMGIVLDTDPATGKLTIGLDSISLQNLNLNQPSGCGSVGDFIIGLVFDIINAVATSFIGDFVINTLLKPQISKAIMGFLPDPPGLAGAISTGAALASFNAPSNAELELLLMAGGYVSAKGGGLNLGVITGMNSDADTSTRQPGETTDPNLCVPSRPAPDLSGVPWNLPTNAIRGDHNLDAAAEFAGSPDPTDANGSTQDIALGLSRSFLNLAGFHLFNSGTLCLAISGGLLSAFNAGAISLLVPSLSNILENRKAPVAVVLRPEQPLVFTIGAGSDVDPLIRVQVTDMRVDFYTFIEERFVRIFTLALDVNVGLNLTITPDPVTMAPMIAPTVVGIDKTTVQARVTNTDLLNEEPAKLAKAMLSLIDVAVGQLTGSIKPIALPSVMGFTLDNLQITRVQTQQDDFVAIYGAILQNPNGTPYPVPQAAVPYRRELSGVETHAQIVDVTVPPPDVIREAAQAGDLDTGNVPSVTLSLGGSRPNLEWSYRVDNGGWHSWSTNARPTIADPNFMLQAKHVIEVRSRVKGDWSTEDRSPARLEVNIDSVPPELHFSADKTTLSFGGWDNVSDTDAIRYSWMRPTGWTEVGPRASLTLDEAWEATHQGQTPLMVTAYDEAGNHYQSSINLAGMAEFHGRTTAATSAAGCGCTIGGARGTGSDDEKLALLALFSILGLAFRRLLRRAPAPSLRRHGAFLALIVVAGLSSVNAGCSCQKAVVRSNVCHLDDDCRSTTCDPGNIPSCNMGACGCTPDVPVGDIGRFSSMAMLNQTAYVAAYNMTYGDLMLGRIVPPGVVTTWDFIDGVPEATPPDNPLSVVRGGVTDPGADVGRYTSVAITPDGNPEISYYDVSGTSLKFALFGAVRWHYHVVDAGGGGTAGELMDGDDIGRYTSLTIGPDGVPGIAYYAQLEKGPSGMPEGQLRYAQALTADPEQASDWKIIVVDTRPLPAVDPTADPPPLPEGIAIFVASARKPDGSPVIAYYDRVRGNLRYVEWDNGSGGFGKPVILDGEDPMGGDTADVGQYPSVAVDAMGTAHISYVDATHDNLLYVNTKDMTPEVADDGYRAMDEVTLDGLPAPVHHLVGDSSSIQVTDDGHIVIGYQDSTDEQLRVAYRDPMTDSWALETIAGHATPFAGAYGFYAQARLSGGNVVLSSYAINQHLDDTSYYVETFGVVTGDIQ